MSATTGFDLKSYLQERAQEVDQALDRYLPGDQKYLGQIGEAMRYSLFPGGKRFRPVLTLAAAEALGADRGVALPAACAFEMIHCFSLVHDDLPCMDDDDVRRGKPSCHKQFGEAIALLAGDALNTWAFYVATLSGSPDQVVQVVRELAEATGHPGMIGGQVIDLDGQSGGVDQERLRLIHKCKTGALIRGSVRAGAILGGADARQLEALSGYGERVGLVFQITDDILDAEEDPEPVSFPALFGLERSRQMAQEATDEAVRLLEPFGRKAEPLRALALYLIDRKS